MRIWQVIWYHDQSLVWDRGTWIWQRYPQFLTTGLYGFPDLATSSCKATVSIIVSLIHVGLYDMWYFISAPRHLCWYNKQTASLDRVIASTPDCWCVEFFHGKALMLPTPKAVLWIPCKCQDSWCFMGTQNYHSWMLYKGLWVLCIHHAPWSRKTLEINFCAVLFVWCIVVVFCLGFFCLLNWCLSLSYSEGKAGGPEAADFSDILHLGTSAKLAQPGSAAAFFSKATRGALLRESYQNLPLIRSCYLSHFVHFQPTLTRSKASYQGQNYLIQSMLLPEVKGPILPSDWPFFPLISLYNKVTNAETRGAVLNSLPLDLVNTVTWNLQWVLLLETWRAKTLQSIPTAAKLARLMCVFLTGGDLFLEAPVHHYTAALLSVYCQTKALDSLNLDAPLPGLASFHDLYIGLLEQFEGVSFGDPLFGVFVLLPLQKRFSVHLRLAVFGEHTSILRALGVPLQQVILVYGPCLSLHISGLLGSCLGFSNLDLGIFPALPFLLRDRVSEEQSSGPVGAGPCHIIISRNLFNFVLRAGSVYLWRAGAVKLFSLQWKLSHTLLSLIIENHLLIYGLYVWRASVYPMFCQQLLFP